MFLQSLTSAAKVEWEFRQANTQEWLAAQVPGGAHTDLMAAGRIPDPFVADNELKVQWVAQQDWEYRAEFDAPASQSADQRIYLVCDGLDTIATVTLNEKEIARTQNMFVQHRFDVTGLLKPGKNEIRVAFRGPAAYASAQEAKRPISQNQPIYLPGGPHMRKAPCHFGWDWGPKLAPVGIWRDIRLEGHCHARLEDVHLRQQHGKKGVTISAGVKAEAWDGAKLIARVKVTAPDGKTFEIDQPLVDHSGQVSLLVKNPRLWWPNGYGPQPLYQVEVCLIADGEVEDRKTYQVGLRTVELSQKPDEWGKSFNFVVNGVTVFIKGSDWIPSDSFPTRVTEASLEGLIRSAAESHQNMLRIWGGGYYEDERFYDLCDRYGVMIWQDMMFACNIYPFDEPAFLENVRHEIRYNIRRLRHRACIALWCGNNEMEQQWKGYDWSQYSEPARLSLTDGYDQFFHHLLPQWISENDTDTAYWPSSPSSNTPFQDANGQTQGDTHYWDVWHGRKPFTAYRGQFPRFMSEFGFQSLPPYETVKTYAEAQDQNMTSYVMELHQRSGNGNGLIIGQMTDTFRMPKDFEALTYLSMVLQAEGIRYGVEHWRRNKHRVGGTLIWQLDDCWPVASWSSLDYFGRWKALHYAAKRFYAPVMLSIEEEKTKMDVHVTSDVSAVCLGKVRWQLVSLSGEVVKSGEIPVQLAPLTSARVAALDFAAELSQGAGRSRELVFIAEFVQDGEVVSSSLATFAPNKHLELRDPHLALKVSKQGKLARIEVSAASLARFVELGLTGSDVVFSDNYIDVPAGATTAVTCPIPAGWSLAQVRKAVRARSLFDSFS